MHRSGTSLVAQVLHAMGVHVGEPERLLPPDPFNPTGYWEHRDALQIDIDLFTALRASRHDVAGIDVGRLSPAARAEVIGRMRRLVHALQERGPFLVKDPRIALLFPLWREAVGRALCVIPWREPAAVGRSLVTRDARPLAISLALWEHYNCTLLRDTAGMPRTLVGYEALLADPVRVAGDLYEWLWGAGLQNLTLPSEDDLRRIVDGGLNRSSQYLEIDRQSVTAAQRGLADALRTGAALSAAAETSPGSLELLTAFSNLEVEAAMLRQRAAQLETLLAATPQSQSQGSGQAF
jgi:hypothetical protein